MFLKRLKLQLKENFLFVLLVITAAVAIALNPVWWVIGPVVVIITGLVVMPFFIRARFNALRREETNKLLDFPDQITDEAEILTSTSGSLLLTDLISLRSWHPTPDLSVRTGPASDLTVTGRRAEELFSKLGTPGPSVYDIPSEDLEKVLSILKERALKLPSVDVKIEQGRISHIERVKRSLSNSTAGIFNIGPSEVLAFKADKAQLVKSWFVDASLAAIDIKLSDKEVVEHRLLSKLDTPTSVITIADQDVLSSWQTKKSVDGLSDLVLHTFDSETAQSLGGTEAEPGLWRWFNLSDEELQRTVLILVGQLGPVPLMAIPHTDEYFMLQQLATAPGAVGRRTYPNGEVVAVRLPDDIESALISRGLDKDGEVASLRLTFNADLSKLFFLGEPTFLEKKFSTSVSSSTKKASK